MPPGQKQQDSGSVPFAGQQGKFFGIEKFGSMNTKAARQSIDDQEFSWNENMMPIGDGNLRSVPSNGASIYTTTAGTTVIYQYFFNIGAVSYVAIFQSDGTAYQVNTSTNVSTAISSTANTFYNGTSLPACAQWGTAGLLIVGKVTGNDYWSWDGTTLIAAGTASASWLNGGTATTMPNGIQGTAIETYQSRVWIANGAVVSFSGPSNGASFSGSTGGGSFTSNDSFLKNKFTAIRQANGFLYLFGDSSINVISNVQTSGSPLATTFNNQNIDPQVGTPWPNSIQAFGRGLVFANQSGVYALYGGAAEKVSDALDGLFAAGQLQLASSNPTQQPSSALSLIYSIRVYLLLIPVPANFPSSSGGAFSSGFSSGFGGTTASSGFRNVAAVWDGKKWFVVSQDLPLSYIAGQEINSVISAWGSNGTSVFPLLSTVSSTLTKTWQTKLWSGDAWVIIKQAMRSYVQANDNSGAGYTITGTIDFQNPVDASVAAASTFAVTYSNSSYAIIWIGLASVVFQFTGLGGIPLNFTSPGETVSGINVNGSGIQIGATLSSTSPDFTLIAFAVLYRNQSAMGG